MKVLDLRCAHDHRFEGWFGSEADFVSQQERGLIECPLCGDRAIERLPSAPRLNVANLREPAPAAMPAAAEQPATLGPNERQALWLQAVRHVLQHTEDVGDRFAQEARRMHAGEIEHRGIRGEATREEAEALRDDGIEIMALPIPAALKGPVQ
ncbi:MAG: DUF1178 family protein [Ideonella sp.]|jgi:hypothetical protein|nr:DUF1178 family protein [Ideonella sp.]